MISCGDRQIRRIFIHVGNHNGSGGVTPRHIQKVWPRL
jgi:hypothetical protein